MSLNPAVASMPVTAPRRSITALVTSVVPCTISLTSVMATFSRESRSLMPSMTASEGSCGVVSRLCTDILLPRGSNSAKSVKVPPTSTPTRYTGLAPPVAHPFGALDVHDRFPTIFHMAAAEGRWPSHDTIAWADRMAPSHGPITWPNHIALARERAGWQKQGPL